MEDISHQIDWLLASPDPWVVYNTHIDLAGADPQSSQARQAYQAMQAHPRVAELFQALEPWPQTQPLKRAYDPKDSLWKLQTLADFGLRRDDERIHGLAEKVFAAQAENGAFLQGGFDHTHSWDTRPYVCIAHIMTYALARFGYVDDPRLQKAYDQILSWQRLDGGWHPNQKNLPGNAAEGEASCPFGTQNVARALAAHPQLREGPEAERAAQFLLECWERRLEPYRPVGFGMGSDWGKLQYPFVQYNLLKTADVLSLIPAARQDPRFGEILDLIQEKRDADGLWRAESASKAWGDYDFAQKKVASAWITFLVFRIFSRVKL